MSSLQVLSAYAKDFRDGQLTGGHRRYAELIHCLSERNKVYLIAPSLTPDAVNTNVVFLQISESRTKSNLVPNALLHTVKVCLTAWRRLRNVRFDAVVVLAISNGLPGLLIKLFWRSKLVIFLLEDPQEYRSLLIKGEGLQLSRGRRSHIGFLKAMYLRLFRFYEEIVLLGSDRIIVESEKYRAILSNRYPQKQGKFRVLQANINTSWITTQAGDYKNTSTQARRFCFVGWIHPRKGLEYLLEAFHELVKADADIYLEIGGTGPLLPDLRARVSQNPELKSRLTFHGWISNPFPLIARCDLLIVPSLSDSFPEVIGEALHAETPVVAARVGGIPEQLEFDELLFEPASVESIILKLQPLIEDDERYQHIRALCSARRKALTFDWGARLEELLEEL